MTITFIILADTLAVVASKLRFQARLLSCYGTTELVLVGAHHLTVCFTRAFRAVITINDGGALGILISFVKAWTVLSRNAFTVVIDRAIRTVASFNARTSIAMRFRLLADIFARLLTGRAARYIRLAILALNRTPILCSPLDVHACFRADVGKGSDGCTETFAVSALVAGTRVIKTVVMSEVNFVAQHSETVFENAVWIFDDAT